MNGAALSTLLSYCVMFFLSSRYIKKLMDHPFNWVSLIKVFFSSALLLLVLLGARAFFTVYIWLLVAVAFPLSLIPYVGLGLVTGVLNREELRAVLVKLRRMGAVPVSSGQENG